MLAAELLTILRCPETRSPLTLADDTLLARLNAEVVAGRLRNRAGQLVDRRLDGGLVRGDGRFLYPIFDDIPSLLIDRSVPLDPLP